MKNHIDADANFWHKTGRKTYTTVRVWKLFTDLLDCFDSIRGNKKGYRKWDEKSVSETNGFLHNISNSSFIVAMNEEMLQSSLMELERVY